MTESDVAREALEVRAASQPLVSANEICAVFDRLAVEISDVLAERCPVLLALMHGGVFAAVELSQRLDFPHEFDYVHATRYGKVLKGGQLDWRVRPGENLRGRHVLVVDDILDKGDTLAAVLETLADIGVERAYSAVLIEKTLVMPRPQADFVGMTVPDTYIFGCGMDYKGFWRGLPDIHAVP